jgi:hypothetical protein
MTERELSQLQREYRAFFLGMLKSYGVDSPAALNKEKKGEFFTNIKRNWAKIKQEKKQVTRTSPIESAPIIASKRATASEEKSAKSAGATVPFELPVQVIVSQPNAEQTQDLKILYTPHDFFKQGNDYHYPVVKMPIKNASLKLPRAGRSNQKGYKEGDFFNQLKLNFPDLDLSDNCHMIIPHFYRPYEPDIVLIDKKLNLYVDIEIDEPYDGYYRYPTHNLKSDGDAKQDETRDLFFTESGWIVIKFTERQVHCETVKCINHIRNVLDSLYKLELFNDGPSFKEEQWDENQAIQWQKIHYRENYLGISGFKKQRSSKEIQIDIQENESIESVIQRTKKFDLDQWNASIAFDEETHTYFDPKDDTGNAEYISVTTIIERFFPFDLKRYIERKAKEESRLEEDILIEHLAIRDEAAEKGTSLHTQIENYLKSGNAEPDLKEFGFFLDFYNNEIKKRNLEFYAAEQVIYSNTYNIAGTVDCLFKKPNIDEYILLDWKRSRKLIIDSQPRIFGNGYASSELSHLDNSSYFRYCLQQNIYKIIIESELSLKISSMKLVVLHENYATYHIVQVPEMRKEAMIILNSLNLKI